MSSRIHRVFRTSENSHGIKVVEPSEELRLKLCILLREIVNGTVERGATNVLRCDDVLTCTKYSIFVTHFFSGHFFLILFSENHVHSFCNDFSRPYFEDIILLLSCMLRDPFSSIKVI